MIHICLTEQASDPKLRVSHFFYFFVRPAPPPRLEATIEVCKQHISQKKTTSKDGLK